MHAPHRNNHVANPIRRAGAALAATVALLAAPCVGTAAFAAGGGSDESTGAATAAASAAGASRKASEAKAQARASWAPDLKRRIVPTHVRRLGSQLATWYGPGLFGNGTACGKTLTRRTFGIAHRTLPCGTLVHLNYRNRRIAVRVIDRGPFSGATVDLTSRTKHYLRFASGHVRMSVVKRYRALPLRSVR